VPGKNVSPERCDDVTVTVPQLSDTVGAIHETLAWQFSSADAVMSAGQPAKTGGVRSSTMTLKSMVAEFPLASVAIQLTRVVPIENLSPECRELLMVTEEQSCVTMVFQVTLAEHEASAPMVISAMRSITGAV
jgi:hypothetical protein